jgi:hypothetical protein
MERYEWENYFFYFFSALYDKRLQDVKRGLSAFGPVQIKCFLI